MDEPDHNKPCPILNLPLEILHQILGHLFFPESQDPRQRVIRNPSKFDIAVTHTCSQLQSKAEAFLYGESTWIFMFTAKSLTTTTLTSKPTTRPYEVLESLPTRIRRIIRKAKVTKGSGVVSFVSSFGDVDWDLLMTFLARECPNLRRLDLSVEAWYPEIEDWAAASTRNKPWVKALLQFETMSCLDWSITCRFLPCDLEGLEGVYLAWRHLERMNNKEHTKAELTLLSTSPPPNPSKTTPKANSPPFNFLKLDRTIRDRIYTHILIPPNKRIHPYIKSWYDITTRHLTPLLTTNKQIHAEATSAFYTTAIFTFSPNEHLQTRTFFKTHLQPPLSKTPSLTSRIRHVRITARTAQDNRMLFIFFKFMRLDSFTLAVPIGILHESVVEQLEMESEFGDRVQSRTWYTEHSDMAVVWNDVSRCVRLLNHSFNDFSQCF